jgi:hypothetical protein
LPRAPFLRRPWSGLARLARTVERAPWAGLAKLFGATRAVLAAAPRAFSSLLVGRRRHRAEVAVAEDEVMREWIGEVMTAVDKSPSSMYANGRAARRPR